MVFLSLSPSGNGCRLFIIYSFSPHSGQNLGLPSIVALQLGQVLAITRPHSGQNFTLGDMEAPHPGHIIGNS